MSDELIKKIDLKIKNELSKIDELERINSEKVLNAFIKEQVAETDFNSTTGYGYNDLGRDKLERIYSDIFKSEDALVRNQFISGSHALTVAFFALLRPGDTLLSITGKPYDTMDEVIGLVDNPSSLKSFGINYMQVDLVNNDFDYDKIKEVITNNKIKVIEIQRSKGYSTRKSLTIEKLEKVISFIKSIDKDIIIMVDNCYCEFVSSREPIEVGADIAVGSLIKNLGGGIAPNGAYIVGRSDLINACSERLTLPGEGKEVGPSLGINKQLFQGLFLAPSVVSSSLKTAIFTSALLEELGYNVEPKYNEERADIVQNIIFNDEKLLIKYTQGIQMNSPIDSNSLPIPDDMPGYTDKVIMASGSFTQGSSIELKGRKQMINKQNLWFLTLFSLILVLSVYYITMPNDLLIASNSTNTKEETKEEDNNTNTTDENTISEVDEADSLTALRVSLDEERDKEKEELKTTMTKEDATTDEKNNAYEQLKYLSVIEGEEEKLEKLIKEKHKLDSFVKVDNNTITVVAAKKKHDVTLANNIMRTIQGEYDTKKTITVKFEGN